MPLPPSAHGVSDDLTTWSYHNSGDLAAELGKPGRQINTATEIKQPLEEGLVREQAPNYSICTSPSRPAPIRANPPFAQLRGSRRPVHPTPGGLPQLLLGEKGSPTRKPAATPIPGSTNPGQQTGPVGEQEQGVSTIGRLIGIRCQVLKQFFEAVAAAPVLQGQCRPLCDLAQLELVAQEDGIAITARGLQPWANDETFFSTVMAVGQWRQGPAHCLIPWIG